MVLTIKLYNQILLLRNWVIATNADFLIPLIPLSLQPNVVWPLIFQTMNSDRLNNQSLKYQRFTPSGFRDIGIGKLGFVAKTQFLSQGNLRVMIGQTNIHTDKQRSLLYRYSVIHIYINIYKGKLCLFII